MKPIEERVRRRAVATFAVALAMGVLGIAAPARAATVVCNPTWEKVNGDGYVVASQDYNLKNGPYGDCGHTGKIKKGTIFYLWCMTTNTYGNNWWYGRIAGTQTMGWAYQEALFGAKANIENDSNDGILSLEGCGPKVIWP
ncbi:hypothetical protein ACTI_59760 [Actinoplanes sp. OR16]|uniref:hypothetical protein n=1 Tax=Actinoplanes sp. OR16 TaxID=946334 RepID=UPI000F71F317|nr:hypothetical protein [Actinoplanes sp. OR16]BBH69291.1 hypothetical protein ACTI_59760 [Actinoplanes sp. OR16]